MDRFFSHYSLHILKKKPVGSKAKQAWQLHETVAGHAHAVKLAKFLANLEEIEKVRLTGMHTGRNGEILSCKPLNTYKASANAGRILWQKLLFWRHDTALV